MHCLCQLTCTIFFRSSSFSFSLSLPLCCSPSLVLLKLTNKWRIIINFHHFTRTKTKSNESHMTKYFVCALQFKGIQSVNISSFIKFYHLATLSRLNAYCILPFALSLSFSNTNNHKLMRITVFLIRVVNILKVCTQTRRLNFYFTTSILLKSYTGNTTQTQFIVKSFCRKWIFIHNNQTVLNKRTAPNRGRSSGIYHNRTVLCHVKPNTLADRFNKKTITKTLALIPTN